MEDSDTAFGVRLRTAREEKGLTQEQLADAIGRVQGSVVAYEGGKLPPVYIATKCAEVTGVTPWWLLFGHGQSRPDADLSEDKLDRDLLTQVVREVARAWIAQRWRGSPEELAIFVLFVHDAFRAGRKASKNQTVRELVEDIINAGKTR